MFDGMNLVQENKENYVMQQTEEDLDEETAVANPINGRHVIGG